MEQAIQHHQQEVLGVLQVLKQASHDLRSNPTFSEEDDPRSSPSPSAAAAAGGIKVLLELETEADTLLSTDPNLATLSRHLSSLKTLVRSTTRRHRRGGALLAFLTRRLSALEVSRLAAAIESDIQAWIDRETVGQLLDALRCHESESAEEQKLNALARFENRVSQGFDRELQDLVLRSRVLASLEKVICHPSSSKKVREQAAFAIASLIVFNKDVFVGEVLMGPTVRCLISMAASSASLLKVLCLLIRTIRSPLVDEIESNGETGSIIAALGSADLQIRVAALDCVLEMGYHGRKEAVEAVLREGLIERLVEMQSSSDLGGDLIDEAEAEAVEERAVVCVDLGEETKGKALMERRPFAGCVARFAVQVEVGEGLRQSEKRVFKQEILRKVREASSISDARVATIVAEVLWGSSP